MISEGTASDADRHRAAGLKDRVNEMEEEVQKLRTARDRRATTLGYAKQASRFKNLPKLPKDQPKTAIVKHDNKGKGEAVEVEKKVWYESAIDWAIAEVRPERIGGNKVSLSLDQRVQSDSGSVTFKE